MADQTTAPKQREVLDDHRRIGKKLVPPFLYQLGPISEVSWVDERIPELIWIGLLLKQCGDRRGIALATQITQAANSQEISDKGVFFVWLSDFERLPQACWEGFRAHLSEAHALQEIRFALSPLLSSYPDCPLGCVREPGAISSESGFASIAEVLMGLYARKSEFATKIQTTAVYLALVSGMLKLVGNEVFADFSEVEQYPRTEASRRVAASIRSTLIALHNLREEGHETSWPLRFWNRGLALEPCQGVFSSGFKERNE